MTDEQLIREILDGHVELFRELIVRYEKRIHAYVYHMLRPGSWQISPEDICQETFYKTYRHLRSFKAEEASFGTWIFTIARNTVLSELRKQKGQTVSLDESLEVVDSSHAGYPEQAVLSKEKVTLVRNAISRLSEKQRSALILREYNQLDYREIAVILGQPINSVKSLLFRARASVKGQLDDYFKERRMNQTYDEVKPK